MERPSEKTRTRGGEDTRLVVVGVGGAGGNAVNRMITYGLSGVNTIAVNTDMTSLARSQAHVRIPIGTSLTRGLGAGGDPSVGKAAAEEARPELKRALEGAQMVFITAGMGGGTGTGASPIVAEVASHLGAVTVAVVTKPFSFEGGRRRHAAETGVDELKSICDTVLVVPNDRLLQVATGLTLAQAFELADSVLDHGVRGITDIINVAGEINVDFADVRATMAQAGTAVMGIGEAEGEDKAVRAAEMAISSPLLETPIDGAMRALINVTSGSDLTLFEVSQAVSMITSRCHPDEAMVKFGWVRDNSFQERARVTVLACGFPGTSRPSHQRAASLRPAERGHPLGEASAAPRYAPLREEPEVAPVSLQTQLAADTDGGLFGEESTGADILDVPSFLRRR